MATGIKDKSDISKEDVDSRIADMESQFGPPSQREDAGLSPEKNSESLGGSADDYMSRGTQDAEDYANQGSDDQQNQQQPDSSQPPNIKKLLKQLQEPNKQFKDAQKRAQKSLKKADKALQKGEKQFAKTVGKQAGKQTLKTGVRATADAAATGATAEIGGVEGLIATEAAFKGIDLATVGGKVIIKGDLKAAEKEAKKDAKWAALLLLMIILGITLPFLWLFFMIFILVGLLTGYNANLAGTAEIPLALTKTGPTEAKAGQSLTYTITANYPAAYDEVTITDEVPVGTVFVGSNAKVTCNNGTCNEASKVITWRATTNAALLNTLNGDSYKGDDVNKTIAKTLGAKNAAVLPASTGPLDATFTITLRATVDNKYVVNVVHGQAVSAGGSGTGSGPAGYVAPNTNNCNGKYNLHNTIRKNFGDPSCDASKEKIQALVKQKDPANQAYWLAVIPCESSYNPNSFNPNTPDPQGAWGLFQVGSSTPIGQPPGAKKDFDRGDVNWPIQIENAVGLLKERGKSYWECG